MTEASFLPEDYLAKQAEKRTNLISLTLFIVVMAAVFGAFLVTNRQASMIGQQQTAIDSQFAAAAMKIEELNELEQQKEKMLHKAELATALLERVPRSILLAELINRMPARLSLQEFEVKSTQIKRPPTRKIEKTTTLSKDRSGGPERPMTREDAMQERAVEAPRYQVQLVMVGNAPTDLEISQYISELNAFDLLDDVSLKYSIQTEVEGQKMREFRVEMKLDPTADVRNLASHATSREELRDPMSNDLGNTASQGGTATSADTSSN